MLRSMRIWPAQQAKEYHCAAKEANEGESYEAVAGPQESYNVKIKDVVRLQADVNHEASDK